MPHNRYFINAPLSQDASITLADKEAHHLLRVMRASIGESFEVIDGKGNLATCTLKAMAKDLATATINTLHNEPPPKHSITLALALTKPSLLEWAVEKSVELGASEFWLFPGDLSDKKELSPTQKNRLEQICISATKQSGRLYLPKILTKDKLSTWTLSSDLTPLLCDPDPQAPYLFSLNLQKQNILLLIGPEKGFSPKEKTALSLAKKVQLHPNTLRAETAPLAALSQLIPYLL